MSSFSAPRLLSGRVPLAVRIHDPWTRAPQDFPLGEFLMRVEVGLGVAVREEWIPLLVGMADGLYVSASVALTRAREGAGFTRAPAAELLPQTPPALLEELVVDGVIEVARVEDIYRAGELDCLQLPRTWELNGWWEALFGVLPMPGWEEEDPTEGEDEDDQGLALGVKPHPLGLQSEDNQIRQLLEKGVLSQTELLYRLKMSVHEQRRALELLKEGWVLDRSGVLQMPAALQAAEQAPLKERLAQLRRLQRKKGPVPVRALEQLERLGQLCLLEEGYTLAS